jgi:hypothetical protein
MAVLNPMLYAQPVDMGRQPVTWLGTVRSSLTNQYVGPAIVLGQSPRGYASEAARSL